MCGMYLYMCMCVFIYLCVQDLDYMYCMYVCTHVLCTVNILYIYAIASSIFECLTFLCTIAGTIKTGEEMEIVGLKDTVKTICTGK